MVSWHEEDPKCEEDKLGDRIKTEGKEELWNWKRVRSELELNYPVGKTGWGISQGKDWGRQRPQSRAVSVEPANLLRWLEATLLCHPPVPEEMKLTGLGMASLRTVIYRLAFPYTWRHYLS